MSRSLAHRGRVRVGNILVRLVTQTGCSPHQAHNQSYVSDVACRQQVENIVMLFLGLLFLLFLQDRKPHVVPCRPFFFPLWLWSKGDLPQNWSPQRWFQEPRLCSSLQPFSVWPLPLRFVPETGATEGTLEEPCLIIQRHRTDQAVARSRKKTEFLSSKR